MCYDLLVLSAAGCFNYTVFSANFARVYVLFRRIKETFKASGVFSPLSAFNINALLHGFNIRGSTPRQ